MNILKLTNGQPERYSFRQLRQDNPTVSFPNEPTTVLLADYDCYKYTIIDPVYDPDTQVAGEWEFQLNGGDWEAVRPVRNMTAQELADKQRNDDIRYIRNGVELIGKLQVQLIDKLLEDLVITPNDFSPNVRQDYLTLKAAVDRVAD